MLPCRLCLFAFFDVHLSVPRDVWPTSKMRFGQLAGVHVSREETSRCMVFDLGGGCSV